MNEGYRIQVSLEETMPEDHILIQCRTHTVGSKVMASLRDMTFDSRSIVLKQDETYIIVDKLDIVFAEVYQKELTVYTIDEEIKTSQSLSSFYENLPKESFVQVSKSSILNIHKIKRVEAHFSGNLLSHLSNGMKTSISRRYVAKLKEKLGI
ncbi:LytR/AlgR family response regulator transcription factor [Salinicoccus sesuvii]|uniref:LytR/AlgR family response regulator transcription factor n=1 Tax=Salinicoccus sesuvii TaxID=868281 RepID=A0ABV7N1U8_9STAP